ncbi:uncharacterized protein LOC135351331 [Halichondria panicea]|uniref:uncharacterized protein LOC135351331 n=1 Tax=Halichondria panicea TaxID=6063 RepID=UPI00312BAC9F
MSAHDHDLLAAAFSAMLGMEVLPPHAKGTMDIPSFSIHQLFHGSHIMIEMLPPHTKGLMDILSHQLFHGSHIMEPCLSILDSPSPEDVFEITVSSLDGLLQFNLTVKKDETVAQIKERISKRTGIPPFQQHLMCAKKELNDPLTLESSGIRPKSRLMLVHYPKAVDNGPPGLGQKPAPSSVTRQLQIKPAPSPVTRQLQGKPAPTFTRQLKPCHNMGDCHKGQCKMNVDDLAPEYDHDYTSMTSGKTYMRGDRPYVRPFGWKRYAVKVLGNTNYKEQDEKNGKTVDAWLGPNGIRVESVKGEWPVSYHGTSFEVVECIVSGDPTKPRGDGKPGYKPSEKNKGGRVVHGDGVYSSPSIDYASLYASRFTKDQNEYLSVLQNRVNPEDGHLIFTADDRIWLSPMQDSSKGIYDVRPYGILIKKVGSWCSLM